MDTILYKILLLEGGKMKYTIGWEIEFPIINNSEFVAWNATLETLSSKLRNIYPKGNLYRDGTPCAEYATQPHENIADLIDECRNVFTQIMDKVPGVLFIGGLSGVESTFSGHIHIGTKQGMSKNKIFDMLETLHGSQTFMELASQNFKTSRSADERACRTNYFKFYHLPVPRPTSPAREYLTYTWNEHNTVENRIPPSSDFYHLATLTVIEKAWIRKFEGKKTFDFDENFNQATRNGAKGNFMLPLSREFVIVDYQTYMTANFEMLNEEIDKELEDVDENIAKTIRKYIEYIKRAPVSNIFSSMTIGEAQEWTKKLVFNGESVINSIELPKYVDIQGKVTEKTLATVISRLNMSKEIETVDRFRMLINAVKQNNPMLAYEQDRQTVSEILMKMRIKNAV